MTRREVVQQLLELAEHLASLEEADDEFQAIMRRYRWSSIDPRTLRLRYRMWRVRRNLFARLRSHAATMAGGGRV